MIAMDAAYGTYAMPKDLIAYAKPSGAVGESAASTTGAWIEIAYGDYHDPGAGSDAYSDIHHEVGHWIQNNLGRPPGAPVNPHYFDTETDEAAAMREGWAEYVAWYTATPDNKNQFTAGAPTYWRGSDDTGVDNAGDIVEGALWRTWATVNDMSGTFKVINDDTPEHIKEWLDGYGADNAWAINTVFEALQENGMVYSRAKIDFLGGWVIPDDAPEHRNNSKEIGPDNITFIRGDKLAIFSDALTKAELNLGPNSDVFEIDEQILGYKEASAGLGEATTVADWTWVHESPWTVVMKFDTKGINDGAYDLAIRVQNEHGWWDNLDPDFAGDATASRNSDEKWLKHLNTWFNQDDNPDNDEEGKVIIDNTPPEVDDASRKPAPN